MRKSIITIGIATFATVGIVYAGGFLSPSGGPAAFNYSYVSSTNSTTTLNAGGPGVFYALTLDAPASASSSVITVFDGTVASNTVIAKITTSASSTQAPQTGIFDVRYQTGLTVQQTGATSTFTVSYQ